MLIKDKFIVLAICCKEKIVMLRHIVKSFLMVHPTVLAHIISHGHIVFECESLVIKNLLFQHLGSHSVNVFVVE